MRRSVLDGFAGRIEDVALCFSILFSLYDGRVLKDIEEEEEALAAEKAESAEALLSNVGLEADDADEAERWRGIEDGGKVFSS